MNYAFCQEQIGLGGRFALFEAKLFNLNQATKDMEKTMKRIAV